MDEEFHEVEETARRLHCAPGTVRRYLRDGTLKGVKRPGSHIWLIPQSEIDRVLTGEDDRKPAA